ncbi:COIL [Branchiostoma lanceolatum]|uniref:COIL protein n=1 Tax=Branchiostoma lanceolatum TaxID=7740 RepID=A0A8S4MQ15_BRALA|nr:COIL [Branchiostoma lanceolatum]
MSGTCVRVRLRFEQAPPLVCGSGPGAWLLVDMDSCRLVADLEFLIKRRFGLSRRRRLHLWMDGFLLPPTEKIAVVRDGDVISVEQTESTSEDHSVESFPPTSSKQVVTSERRQKRKKAETSEEDGPDTAELRIQDKDRKRKKHKLNGSDSGVSTSSSAMPVAATKTKEVQKPQTKKKAKKQTNEKPGKASKLVSLLPKASGTGSKKVISKPAMSKGSAITGGKPNSTKIVKPVPTKSRGKVKDSSSSSSSSEDTSSSSDDSDPDSDSSSGDSRSSGTSVEVKPRSSVNTKTCSRPGPVSKPLQRNNKPDSSSSDSSSSDTDDDVNVNKQTHSKQAAVSNNPGQRQSSPKQNGNISCNSAKVFSIVGNVSEAHTSVPPAPSVEQAVSTRHVSAVLTVPITQRLQAMTTRKQPAASSSHPKLKAVGPSSNSKGHIVFDSDSESDSGSNESGGKGKALQVHAPDKVVASHVDVPETSTPQAPDQAIHGRRKSSRSENAPPPAPPPVPKDYDALPPLHGPPRAGDRIAYKILEMSASYCPEISSYKEAVVTGYDPTSGDLEVEMVYDITAYMKQNQPGRFEMDMDVGGQEDKPDNKVTVAVSALVEPKLVQD